MRYMRKLHPYLDIIVSSLGEVYLPQSGKNPAKWTFGSKDSYGYRRVKIANKRYAVHRLVVETFIGNIPEGYEVDHASRVRDYNCVDGLRIVTHKENLRNTSAHDRVEAQGRTHKYEDEEQYRREKAIHYKQSKRKTHRRIQFSDGSHHWIPNDDAVLLLAIPLNQRTYKH